MRAKATRRLRLYLILTFALTWTIQIVAGLSLGTFVHGEESSPLVVPIIGLTMFTPSLATIVTLKITGELTKFDLGLRPKIRENVGPYLIAWLCPMALTILGATLYFLAFPDRFDPTHSYLVSLAPTAAQDAAAAIEGAIPATLAAATLVAPLINALPALGEEIGWRSLLFPTLAEVTSTRQAALVSGIIWGIWHAPVIAMGHNYGMDTPLFPLSNIAVMTLACVAIGILFTELRLRSGSVWPCALAHGAINAAANLGLIVSSTGPTLLGPNVLALVSGLPTILLALASLAYDRSALRQ